MKHFKRFGSGFTELHAKLDADKTKHNVKKSTDVKTMHVHSVVSCGRLVLFIMSGIGVMPVTTIAAATPPDLWTVSMTCLTILTHSCHFLLFLQCAFPSLPAFHTCMNI
jgi:hypothetical protein